VRRPARFPRKVTIRRRRSAGRRWRRAADLAVLVAAARVAAARAVAAEAGLAAAQVAAHLAEILETALRDATT